MIPRILNGLRVLLLGAALATQPAFAESVTAMFSKAQKALKEGKTKAAYKGLLGIVRRYPDHEPSHLLLGHILTRAGESGKAYKHFKRVSPDLVTPDLGYEYGLIMFQAKNCTKAIQGFGKVPSASRYADLASFYKGICYYRGRQYQKAQYFLSNAKNLPTSLQATRRQALSEARQAARRERQGGPYQTNPYLIVPTPPPMPLAYDPYATMPPPGTPEASPQAPATPAAPAKKPEKPAPPPSGMSTAITPSLTITQKTSTLDYFGFKNTQTDSSKQELKASVAWKYTGGPRPSGGQPYLSVPVDLSQSNESTKGETVAYKAYSDDPGTTIEEQTQIPGATTQITGIKTTPTGDYPLSGKSDISAGYLIDMKTIKVSTSSNESKNSEMGPVLNGALGGESYNLKLTYAHTVIHDEKVVNDGELKNVDQDVKTDKDKIVADLDKMFDSVTAGVTVTSTTTKSVVAGSSAGAVYQPSSLIIAGDMTKNWETVAVTATVTQTTTEDQQFEGFKPIGPTSTLKIELSGTKTFSFGGAFTLTVTQNQLSEYRRAVTLTQKAAALQDTPPAPTVVDVKANGTEQTVFTSFKLTPLDWLFGLASYKTTTRVFESIPAEAQLDFQQAEPETITELIFQVGVSKTF